MNVKASVASIFVLAGISLSSQPALSQSAMGGAPAVTPAPAPRLAPTPRAPAVMPNASVTAPTPSTTGAGIKFEGTTNVEPLLNNSAKASGGGARQEPSKAPLPSGYAYDATGRIVFVGTDATGKTGGAAPGISESWSESVRNGMVTKDTGKQSAPK